MGQSLVFAAGVVMAVVFVSVMIMEFENSKKLSDAVNENILELASSVKSGGVMMYDGVRVRGADVLNFGKKYFYGSEDERTFCLQIIDASGEVVVVSDRQDMEKVVKASGTGTDSDAVDPAADYLGEVEQNENGIVISVVFRQV